MKELHFTKKDFLLEWFSGTGAGGQHRNKHCNCCRITHIETGLKAQGTGHRDRISNQRMAFNNLAKLILAKYSDVGKKPRFRATQVIRNYHGVRNEVHDKASGLKLPFKQIVTDANIGPMIDARRASMSPDEDQSED